MIKNNVKNMISVDLKGRLGNQLWQYAVCRTVAEKLGYDFHIPRTWAGRDIFNCDLGVETNLTTDVYPTQNAWNLQQIYDQNIFKIKDFTRLQGWFQSEEFILANRQNILKWFTINDPFTSLEKILSLDENMCVINFRGGDYQQFPDLYLNKYFYNNACYYMQQKNKNMQFVVITDDEVTAKKIFGQMFKCYHLGPVNDFFVLTKAKNLIVSNSTFSWWGAWLNQNNPYIIAPKFWMRHNSSNGWWLPCDSITSMFNYIDRDGMYFTAEECRKEITDYNYLVHDVLVDDDFPS